MLTKAVLLTITGCYHLSGSYAFAFVAQPPRVPQTPRMGGVFLTQLQQTPREQLAEASQDLVARYQEEYSVLKEKLDHLNAVVLECYENIDKYEGNIEITWPASQYFDGTY